MVRTTLCVPGALVTLCHCRGRSTQAGLHPGYDLRQQYERSMVTSPIAPDAARLCHSAHTIIAPTSGKSTRGNNQITEFGQSFEVGSNRDSAERNACATVLSLEAERLAGFSIRSMINPVCRRITDGPCRDAPAARSTRADH